MWHVCERMHLPLLDPSWGRVGLLDARPLSAASTRLHRPAPHDALDPRLPLQEGLQLRLLRSVALLPLRLPRRPLACGGKLLLPRPG